APEVHVAGHVGAGEEALHDVVRAALQQYVRVGRRSPVDILGRRRGALRRTGHVVRAVIGGARRRSRTMAARRRRRCREVCPGLSTVDAPRLGVVGAGGLRGRVEGADPDASALERVADFRRPPPPRPLPDAAVRVARARPAPPRPRHGRRAV
uniref:Uncharacterized protein n=1 Tax=Triticum urartu TaxID=4572 RepID=A0A8R7QEA2_TRIUA